jgi:hypothetical protein
MEARASQESNTGTGSRDCLVDQNGMQPQIWEAVKHAKASKVRLWQNPELDKTWK